MTRQQAREAIIAAFGGNPDIYAFRITANADQCKAILDAFDPGFTGEVFGMARLMVASVDAWAEVPPAFKPDLYGRKWPNVAEDERCRTCGQPDNCGDCSHVRLSKQDVLTLGGTLPHKPDVLVGVELGDGDCDECGAPMWQDEEGDWLHVLVDDDNDPIGLQVSCIYSVEPTHDHHRSG